MNERKMLLMRLSAAQFAAWELHLYLDTHPCDRAAAALFEKHSADALALKNEYVSKYGALEKGDGEIAGWLRDPWPWDITKGENANV